jgi:hypothetical protein
VIPVKRRSHKPEKGDAQLPPKKLKSVCLRTSSRGVVMLGQNEGPLDFQEKKRRRTSGFSDLNAFQGSSPEREEQRKPRKVR